MSFTLNHYKNDGNDAHISFLAVSFILLKNSKFSGWIDDDDDDDDNGDEKEWHIFSWN